LDNIRKTWYQHIVLIPFCHHMMTFSLRMTSRVQSHVEPDNFIIAHSIF
jgi:hypothetical protein